MVSSTSYVIYVELTTMLSWNCFVVFF
jgi:hypothetical protein